ncbi:MAG: hypothetical protein QNJ54_06665 [Prochloraceae cyanobacterium]|nr:hypothetical protein [Prochloraceae cyanobacterium]
MSGDRNIKMGSGNYNEKIEGDYIQGNSNNNIDRSRTVNIGDINGDFSPNASPILSDNAQIENKVTQAAKKQKPDKKKPNKGIIISIIAIIITACISGLFNPEIRQFLNLDSPSQTQEVQKDK